MECKDYREQIPALLNGELDETLKNHLFSHIWECTGCSAEYESAKKIWELMGEMPQPEPSPYMKAGFESMLSGYKKAHASSGFSFSSFLEQLFGHRMQPGLSFSVLMLTIGLIIGYILHRPPQQQTLAYSRQIDSLTSQVSEMRQVMMLSMLQDPSASQRIKAVSYTDDLSKTDAKVVNALLTTLNEDPNVNVRLATLEALTRMAAEPIVREGLVRSITKQDSPIMQSAIADLMVKLQEKSSVESLRELLNKKDLNKMVKINIEKSIQKLI
jgi:hypothetical protein